MDFNSSLDNSKPFLWISDSYPSYVPNGFWVKSIENSFALLPVKSPSRLESGRALRSDDSLFAASKLRRVLVEYTKMLMSQCLERHLAEEFSGDYLLDLLSGINPMITASVVQEAILNLKSEGLVSGVVNELGEKSFIVIKDSEWDKLQVENKLLEDLINGRRVVCTSELSKRLKLFGVEKIESNYCNFILRNYNLVIFLFTGVNFAYSSLSRTEWITSRYDKMFSHHLSFYKDKYDLNRDYGALTISDKFFSYLVEESPLEYLGTDGKFYISLASKSLSLSVREEVNRILEIIKLSDNRLVRIKLNTDLSKIIGELEEIHGIKIDYIHGSSGEILCWNPYRDHTVDGDLIMQKISSWLTMIRQRNIPYNINSETLFSDYCPELQLSMEEANILIEASDNLMKKFGFFDEGMSRPHLTAPHGGLPNLEFSRNGTHRKMF